MSHFNEHALEMGFMELFEQQGCMNCETIHKEQTENFKKYRMNPEG